MPTILERTYSAVKDNRIVLNNSSFCRPFFLGNWNKIRVCVRLSMNGSATITGSPHYSVGFCSGATMFNGATSQFIGIIGNVVTGISMVYFSGPPAYYSTRHYVGRKIGTSIVGTTGNYSDANNCYATNSYMSVYQNSGVPMRDLMFATITRPGGATVPTSGAYPVSMFVKSSNSTFTDATVSHFLTQGPLTVPSHVAGSISHTSYGNDYAPGGSYLAPGGTIAADEITYGAFDHVMVGWDKTLASLEISDVGVVRLS